MGENNFKNFTVFISLTTEYFFGLGFLVIFFFPVCVFFFPLGGNVSCTRDIQNLAFEMYSATQANDKTAWYLCPRYIFAMTKWLWTSIEFNILHWWTGMTAIIIRKHAINTAAMGIFFLQIYAYVQICMKQPTNIFHLKILGRSCCSMLKDVLF